MFPGYHQANGWNRKGGVMTDLFETDTEYALSVAIGNRNYKWKNNPLIPKWVDITSAGLDRYFTQDEIAKHCYISLVGNIRKDSIDPEDCVFVEPSAGNGSFFKHLPTNSRIGIDIVPNDHDYIVDDFLSWKPRNAHRKYAVIGNPPFGYRGWLALSFVNHAASFADYIGMILPMSFQSEGKGSPKHRVVGAELIYQEHLPNDSFVDQNEQRVKLNALWQIWKKGDNRISSPKTCNTWIDLFTVDKRKERLCGQKRLKEANWLLQRTFYGEPPSLVTDFSDVKYGCGYGIVIKKEPGKVEDYLFNVDWRKYSNLAVHNCRHISMYHIRNAMIDGGFCDVRSSSHFPRHFASVCRFNQRAPLKNPI